VRRREFIAGLGGAVAWPLTAWGQRPSRTVALVSGRPDESARFSAAFRTGLSETGHVESENVAVEFHWLNGQYERLPSLMADFVRRRVAVIVSPDSAPTTLAAKAATATIPIVFGIGDDPVKLGLVASLARPGGNATGISFLNQVIVSKQLGLLHELIPNAVRIAVLVNPANVPSTEATLQNTSDVARALGLQIQVLKYRPRNRGGFRDPCPRTSPGALHLRRIVPQQPARPTCHSGGAVRDSDRPTH
jgi:putative tryptophan/tyrosine transport system substrate-binding protein